MTSQAIRDQVSDHLLTPKNAALIVIDYQPVQVSSIQSMDRGLLVDNIVRVARKPSCGTSTSGHEGEAELPRLSAHLIEMFLGVDSLLPNINE
jgi:hypothetical protein